MLLWSEQRWAEEVRRAGFEVLHQWRSGKRSEGGDEEEEAGTMSIIARNVGAAHDGEDDVVKTEKQDEL